MYNYVKILAVSLLLSACGSDNNSAINPMLDVNPSPMVTATPAVTSTPEPESTATPVPTTTPDALIYTGVFIDSAVQGLTYQTATQSGVTNEYGEFSYQAGEQITFSIGDISFPSVAAKSTITPLTLFNTDEVNTPAVVNTLRLLQSLDSDATPSNGITIPANAITLADNGTIDFTSADFDALITPYLIEIGGINQQLISAQQAIYHFDDTMENNMPPTGSSCGNDHPMVGYTGSFSTIAHGVSGNATIIDNCTIEITDFNYDGGGPLVYFYAGQNQVFTGDSAFQLGDLLTGTQFSDETVMVKVPSNKSLDNFNSISVWCVDFDVDFGNVIFTAP